MLGSACYKVFSESSAWSVVGTVRSYRAKKFLSEGPEQTVIANVDIENFDSIVAAFAMAKPDIVINAIGVIKQLDTAKNPLVSLPVNSMLPHRLSQLCAVSGSRLVHISTDCVFTGQKGRYHETDLPDALDLYGRSKLLGEVDAANTITLRTSIIGEELDGGASGLVGWFLAQKSPVKGYRRAVFSGLPTVVLARIIRDLVSKNPELSGVFHVSAEPINKYDLLCLVRDAYARDIDIDPDDSLVIDRSLDSSRFRSLTGFVPPRWPDLIHEMRQASDFWSAGERDV